MSEAKQILDRIIENFDVAEFSLFFREKSRHFAEPKEKDCSQYNDELFTGAQKLGEIKFSDSEQFIICAFKSLKELSERSSKKAQYDKAKEILKKNGQVAAGIFIFYDANGSFRFSLVYPETLGNRRIWSNFRRFTYFVNKEFTNKTFLARISKGDFSSINKIKEAFSLSAVTDIFYNDFFVEYNKLVEAVKRVNGIAENDDKARDFVLLFAIRIIFLGFVQKKGWLGNDERFIQSFLKEYESKYQGKDLFYEKWITPLFFEALSSPPGRKVSYRQNDFSTETENKLQMAPFLNGGLFKNKQGYDDKSFFIPDNEIKSFFDFLFSHNFTIEENSYDDEDLQLNPEFLGIIFERLVNKADGAVYTPRTEVDLMCRLSIVKWLGKNLENPIKKDNLYELFFKEGEAKDEQKTGSFSSKEINEILLLVESISICDPAVGSGAFLVGMMQVLDEIMHILKGEKLKASEDNIFERKKRIIAQSLYGVEVKEWAVWICQLRLWLSLFIDAPDNLKYSTEPILPSLEFKVRQGDSLVQRIGSKSFPVLGHASVSNVVKSRVTELKKLKLEYFGNKSALKDWEIRQNELDIYRSILINEINDKKRKIDIFEDRTPETQSLFGEDFLNNNPKQQKLEFSKKEIEQLRKEIAELEWQRDNICDNKSLIWNIEFAEIFVEKEGFDIVIGNPPYVRQESIADPTEKIENKKEYKDLLAEMVRMDFSGHFSAKTKINAQSDLYTYFYIRALRLLNPKGVQTFICSNSWLDVGYGVWLQDFLLNRCPVEFIIDNHAKRSFEAADVNTIISLIHAPSRKIDEKHLTKFVAFKRPFEESIYTEFLLQIENAKEILSNDVFRVYPVSIKELRETGTEYEEEDTKKIAGKYAGDKWGGKYLRAPDIFFKILEKGKGKLVKLGDVAEVKFGIKTGCNEFFYLTDDQIRAWKIESEFLKPVIKSPRECKSILINPKDLKYKIFICNKSKAELIGTNALKYIEWGETQEIEIKQGGDKGKTVIGFHNISSVQGRKYWYGLGDRKVPDFIFPCGIREKYKVYLGSNVLADKRLYEIYSLHEKAICSLNSTMAILNLEMQSRSYGGGGGLIDATVDEVEKLYIITPDFFTFNKLDFDRDIQSIFEECGIDPKSETPIEEQEPKPLSDRAELDKIVFDALDLTEDERKDVYRAVCRLVWNRISKARSV